MGMLEGLISGLALGTADFADNRMKMQHEELQKQADRDKEARIEEAQIRMENRASINKETDYQKSISPDRVQTAIDIALQKKSAEDKYTKDNWGDHISQLKDETNAKESDSDKAFNAARSNYYNMGGSAVSGSSASDDRAIGKQYSAAKDMFSIYRKEVEDIQGQLDNPDAVITEDQRFELNKKLLNKQDQAALYKSKMESLYGGGPSEPAPGVSRDDPGGLRAKSDSDNLSYFKTVGNQVNTLQDKLDKTSDSNEREKIQGTIDYLKNELSVNENKNKEPVVVAEVKAVPMAQVVISRDDAIKNQNELYEKNKKARENRQNNGLLRSFLLSDDEIEKQNKARR